MVFRSLELIPEVLFGKLDNFALLSIPMFILMGAAIASTRAGADLYEALDRWLTRVHGGLVVSNLGACALFAAMSGSSPATCAAIGKMGILKCVNETFRWSRSRFYCGRRDAWDLNTAIDNNDRLWNCHRDLNRTSFHRGCFARTASC